MARIFVALLVLSEMRCLSALADEMHGDAHPDYDEEYGLAQNGEQTEQLPQATRPLPSYIHLTATHGALSVRCALCSVSVSWPISTDFTRRNHWAALFNVNNCDRYHC